MAVSVEAADVYFNESVFHNDAWINADVGMKKRALKNATAILNRIYKNRNIPDEAIFEQALWLMKVSEAQKQAEQGVVYYSIDGINVTLSQVDRTVAPSVVQIMGRRVGRSESGRTGYIVSGEKYMRPPSGGV